MDLDNPWIAQRKPWIHTLRDTRIARAIHGSRVSKETKYKFADNHGLRCVRTIGTHRHTITHFEHYHRVLRLNSNIFAILATPRQLSHTRVRREERIWGDNRDRPGDIFHPDFDDGRPTYFDISARHTLQPGNLNRASTNAGAAAVAGEMVKDQKHAAI